MNFRRTFCLLCLSAISCLAQFDLPFLATLNDATASGGGGGAGFALVASDGKEGNGTTVTTDAVDSTGATLGVAVATYYEEGASFAITDSKGNTWTPLTVKSFNGSGTYNARIYYCINPIVGSGHTVTLVATLPNLNVAFFSGDTPEFDSESGANGGAGGFTTLQPGSITPDGDNQLFITGVTFNQDMSTASINSSFTKTTQAENTAGDILGSLAYKIQTSASAENPTWTISAGGNAGAAVMATFK